MTDVNFAANVAQPIVLGNKLLTPGADGKTVNITNKDGSDAQSMDLEAFKKYLAEHKEEIIAQANKGDTTSFKGRETDTEKKGLSTGTLILGAAALVGIGVWQHKTGNLQKAWKYVSGLFNKTKTENVTKEVLTEAEKQISQTSVKANETLLNAKKIEPEITQQTASVKNTSVHETTGEAKTPEQIATTIENLGVKNADAKTRKIVEQEAVTGAQQTKYDKEVEYQKLTPSQQKTKNKIDQQVKKDYDTAHQIQNNSKIKENGTDVTTNPLNRVKQNIETKTVASAGVKTGSLPDGKKYTLEIGKKGEVTSITYADLKGGKTTDAKKIAIWLDKHGINPAEVQTTRLSIAA